MEQSSLPKNIRQIGQADKKLKIYIEDYVITFARKLEEKNKNSGGMAVLLGKASDKDNKEPVFIRGAVEITGYEDNKGVSFNNEMWSDIYEGVKNYFPDQEIVGWMLFGSNQTGGFDEKIKGIHQTNFGDSSNLLFVFDKEEKEENFYHLENGQFIKYSGYYIYYEKNESMQSYMIDSFGNKSQEPKVEDKVIEQVRDVISSKEQPQDNRTVNFVYAASTALAAVVLVMGATTLTNYDKMRNMEETLNHISANMEEEDENELVVETITGTVGEETEQESGQAESDNQSEAENVDGTENVQEVVGEEHNFVSTESNLEENSEINGEEEEAAASTEIIGQETETETSISSEAAENETSTETMAENDYYIVKKGDTLVTISGAIYGSDEYVEAIQAANQIDDKDMIYEGQKLILP